MQTTIEEKLSSDNGKVIKFVCTQSTSDLSMFGFKNSELVSKECIVRSRTQKLIFKTTTPIGPAAILDIRFNSAGLVLEDDSLIKEDIENEANERQRAYEEATKKAKSDI